MKDVEIKKAVRERYAKVVTTESSCCGPTSSCGGTQATVGDVSRRMGYTDEDVNTVPEGSNLGLGCGNPIALASLKGGEIVLDLGSGGGFDCFLAADRVGKEGKVIGVDMTPEMLEKARGNADKGGYKNVEFRLGEIETLPAADNSVDVVISNCVINLSPDKLKVFQEAYRVLKPGGRLMVSDIVLLGELPDSVKNSVEAYAGCVSGAMMRDEYLETIRTAGFQDVKVEGETVVTAELWGRESSTKEIPDTANALEEELRDKPGAISSLNVSAVKTV
jgi:SAM-dependent methyltransferase